MDRASGTNPYEITLSKQALKYLVRMRPADGKRLRAALDRLAANPDRQDMDIKPLLGRPAFRLRVGDYRVIFQREDRIRILAVDRIAPRGDAYKL